MGLEFITRVIRTTAIVALLAALCLAVYFDWKYALGFLVGVAWSLLNLTVIRGLIKEVVSPHEARKNVAALLALLKFPLLYVAGYFILVSEWFSVSSLMIGFSLMFAVIVLKVLGRLVLGLDVPGLRHKQSEESV
jgi:hypothetical protein